MNDKIVIRRAATGDCNTIVDLGKRTFIQTYSEIAFDESLELHVGGKFAPDRILEELENPEAIFYIAFKDEVPVAFTKLRFDRKPGGIENKKALEIERIYVLREYQGFKVGRQLMDYCIQFAKDGRYEMIWLQVWQKNQRAIQFYQKSGFVIFDTAIFNYVAGQVQDDFLMRLDLYY